MSKNPLAKNKFLKIFNKNNDMKSIDTTLSANIIGINNAMTIVSQACSCCWDKPVPVGYDNMREYVRKRTKTGHTSILEHSNFIIYISFNSSVYLQDLAQVLSHCRYLHTCVRFSDSNKCHLLIGGSFRGYSYLLHSLESNDNAIAKSIVSLLYETDSAYFEDIISENILDANNFNNVDISSNSVYGIYSEELNSSHKLFDIVGADSIASIINNLYKYYTDDKMVFTVYDLLDFGTLSVLFKNMSRTCTHQLVRHRNAITQESQRYVDYSSASFSNPATFKPDKYDKNYKYTVRFGQFPTVKMTLQEIGVSMMDIYRSLISKNDNFDNALIKEDARAFLPSNVQCKKIYMTFTYRNLIKFLQLREDKAAQAEIRTYANALGNWFRENSEKINIFPSDINTALFPKYIDSNSDNIGIDVINDKTNSLNYTEDEFISKVLELEENKK